MDYLLLWNRFRQQYPDQRGSAQKQLHACLRHAIQQGTLASGTRLASSRTLAQELGIARNTVVFAYEQLLSEGFLTATRRGSVVNSLELMQEVAVAQPAEVPNRRLSKRGDSLMPLPVPSDLTTAFAPGVPSLADFPMPRWRKMLEQEWRNASAADLGYGQACGEMSLRIAIADYLRASRGVLCDPEQVFITDGTQSSLDLCARVFADVGDKVWIENPGYVGAQVAFRGAQLKMVGIAVDDDGIAPKASDWRTHTPRLIYVTPSHQYPTGKVMSLPRRLELLKQAQLHQSLIVEDDYDSEFRHDGPPLPAMQGLVPNAPVLYLGTFSKTLFPAIRIAYIIAPRDVLPAFEQHLLRSFLRGRSVEQRCLARFVSEGYFAQHIRRMRRLYRERRDTLVDALQRHMSNEVEIHGDLAGMHLAIRFRDSKMDDVAVSRAALAAGIVAPALSLHKVGQRQNAWCGLMLGYAQVPSEQMEAQVQKLARVVVGYGTG